MCSGYYQLKVNSLVEIRRNIKTVSFPSPSGSALFALLYHVNERSHIILRSPSSRVELCTEGLYPVLIGYAGTRQQFAEVIHHYFTS